MDLSFLQKGAVSAARELIGWRFYKADGGTLVGGVIVETEAYNENDAASHTYRGPTPRNQVMFGPAGYIYVYFTYGMHFCVNIVAGQSGHGEAVLLRALEPDQGLEIMEQRRDRSDLTGGPAKLCQALNITGADNGKQLNHSDVILLPPEKPLLNIKATKRIGIKRDTHRLWRFVVVQCNSE